MKSETFKLLEIEEAVRAVLPKRKLVWCEKCLKWHSVRDNENFKCSGVMLLRRKEEERDIGGIIILA